MPDAALILVLVGLGVPFYSYAAYPVFLFAAAACVQVARDVRFLLYRGDRRRRTHSQPSVSIIMSAYNEETVIQRTLESCLNSDYPADRLEVVVGLDGCTDDTEERARQYEDRGVRVLNFNERRGKISVLKDCVRRATGDIIVFTDANTRIEPDAVQKLIRHFENPQIGAVCGELRLERSESGENREGFYWRYEVALKTLESRLNGVLGANGSLYALRKELFPDLTPDIVTDDFVIPMKVKQQGYDVTYDPEAVAREKVAGSAGDEYRRRVRIGAGNWQALRHCASLLLPWKGFASVSFWSHKVFRWLTPFLLVVALLANFFVLDRLTGQVLFAMQALFYGTAALGHLLQKC
ncbi:MAG: glycosyltransferase family 2 protein, partial [Planctomycetota bacterium]